MTECSIEGCGRPQRARGWCKRHHWAWKTHGDPLGGNRRYSTAAEAFVARTERRTSGCLIWTGAVDESGYGQLRDGNRRVSSHRYAWEARHGSIPEGMTVDHRYHCDKRCCAVEHLRLATNTQNQWNRNGPHGKRDLPRGVRKNRLGYQAYVQANKKRYYGGTFSTVAEADAAARALREKHFGDFAGRAIRTPERTTKETS